MVLSIKPTRRDLIRMANQRANDVLEKEIEELDRQIAKSREEERTFQQKLTDRHSTAGEKAHAVMLAKMRVLADEMGLRLSVTHSCSDNVVRTDASLHFTGQAKIRKVKLPNIRLTKMLADRKQLQDRQYQLNRAGRDLSDPRGEWELLNEFATGKVAELLGEAAQVLADEAKRRAKA